MAHEGGEAPDASPDVSIVIAVLDEAGNVGPLAREIAAVLAGERHEIVFVDDGSTDATAAEIMELMPVLPGLRLVRHARRSGQSAALMTGARAARAPMIVTLDGDGQNDPADIPALLAIARGRPRTLVAGIRRRRRDTRSKRIASSLANGFRRAVLRDGCPDTGCGLKAFPRDAFLDLPYFNGLHRYLPALFQTAGLDLALVTVGHRERRAGRSKYNNLGRALVGIVDVFGVVWLRRRMRRSGAVTEEAPAGGRARP